MVKNFNPYGENISLKSVNKNGEGDISVGEPISDGNGTYVLLSGKNNYKGTAKIRVED